ncbi:MAG: hypothetical protein GXO79_06160, partial [Chlorobi bacterium]|nr:hypothetical protein [Chlorobiota bacterium]
IKEADFEQKEKSSDERKYYRFINPSNKEFPWQIELFSRVPDLFELYEDAYLTPIPTGEGISSLSAILLNEDYYSYTIKHSTIEEDIHIANTEALICLKAKAFLDMIKRKAEGEKIDSKHIKKHKSDIFRMASTLTAENVFELPFSIKNDMNEFVKMVKEDLPDKDMFKRLGIGNIDVQALFKRLIDSFKLKE